MEKWEGSSLLVWDRQQGPSSVRSGHKCGALLLLHGDEGAFLPPPAGGMSPQITGVKQTTGQGMGGRKLTFELCNIFSFQSTWEIQAQAFLTGDSVASACSSLNNPFSRTVCGSFLQLSKAKQWVEIQFWEPVTPACSLKSERLGQNVRESQGTITQKVKVRWFTGPGDSS